MSFMKDPSSQYISEPDKEGLECIKLFKAFKKSFYQEPTDEKIEKYLKEVRKITLCVTNDCIDLNFLLGKYKLSGHYSVIDILYYNALVLNTIYTSNYRSFNYDDIERIYYNYDIKKVSPEIEIYILKKICIDYFDIIDKDIMILLNHYINGKKMEIYSYKVYLGK